MAFRNMETLQAWVAEYRALEKPLAGSARVMVQDGDGGANTGLVVFRLDHAPADVFIQPVTPDATRWVATLEPRAEELALDPAGLRSLAAELSAIADLCTFLEAKSAAYQGHDVA